MTKSMRERIPAKGAVKMKKIFAASILLCCLAVPAQAPTVMCPVHHVPAYITGQTQKDGEGRTTAWQYCHGTGSDQHCFWGHD